MSVARRRVVRAPAARNFVIMRILIGSIITLVIVASVSVASGQVAPEDRGAPALTGRYVLAGASEEARETVHRAIDEAVGEMSFFVRRVARSRLREKNPVRRELEIDVSGDMVTVAYGDQRYRSPEGRWQTVTATGEQVQLLHQLRGNRLYQTFRSDDGEKLTVYTLSDDGRFLWLDVTVRSPQLPSPLTYRLSYRRTSPDRDPVATR